MEEVIRKILVNIWKFGQNLFFKGFNMGMVNSDAAFREYNSPIYMSWCRFFSWGGSLDVWLCPCIVYDWIWLIPSCFLHEILQQKMFDTLLWFVMTGMHISRITSNLLKLIFNEWMNQIKDLPSRCLKPLLFYLQWKPN